MTAELKDVSGEVILQNADSTLVAALLEDEHPYQDDMNTEDNDVNITIRLAEHDAGRVIGREGRTINAIRHVMQVAVKARVSHAARIHISVE